MLSMPTVVQMGTNPIAPAFGPKKRFINPALEASEDALSGNNARGTGGRSATAAPGEDKTSEAVDLAQNLQLQQAELQRMQQMFQFQTRQMQLGMPGTQPPTQFAGLLSAKSSEVSMLQRRLEALSGGGSLGGQSALPLGSDQPLLSFFA